MKTPGKDYISALRQGSYGFITPPTSSSVSPNTSSLTIHQMPEISIFNKNQLMIDLQSQNLRLMEKYLDLLEQRRSLRIHCRKGMDYWQTSDWANVKEELIAMKQILCDGCDRDSVDDFETSELKKQLLDSQRLIEELKSVLSESEILPNTREQILESDGLYPEILRGDLDLIKQQLKDIQNEIIDGTKLELSRISRLFSQNKKISQIDVDGEFSHQLSQLVSILSTIIKEKSKMSMSNSQNTSLDKIVKQEKGRGYGSMGHIDRGMERDSEMVNGLYYMLLLQAQKLEEFEPNQILMD